MESRSFRAYFDGNQIRLNEPIPLEPNTQLLVTILSPESDDEREDWAQFSMENLSRSYSDIEPEYSFDLIKEANPEYEGR